jgi:UDP-glucuronate 4-epimerase
MATLVTGAAGFIAYHVTRALVARGVGVVGIDNLDPYYDTRLKKDRLADLEMCARGNFRFLEVDFSAADALERALERSAFDRIVHLGAQPGVRYSIEEPRKYVSANLVGHLNILELARQRQSSHLVYASSSSVYGGNSSLPFRIEDRVDHPISLYAATKKADELMSEAYAHLYRIPMTGLRFFTVYGPWGRPDMAMWTFTERILRGETLQVFNEGRMRRDFTYIDDIVTGVLACLDKPPLDDNSPKTGGSLAPHSLYNIGSQRSEDLMETIRLIEDACGRRAHIELLPMQAGDIVDTYADVSAIGNELGYAPRTTIQEGVPRFVHWYKGYQEARKG